jgi:hypothetical protein
MKERRNISKICSFKFLELNSSEFSSLEDAEKSEIGKAAALERIGGCGGDLT